MVKLFLKNSNLCDHNSPTSQTDGRTDRQTTCDRNTALCTKVYRAVKIERQVIGIFSYCSAIMVGLCVSIHQKKPNAQLITERIKHSYISAKNTRSQAIARIADRTPS